MSNINWFVKKLLIIISVWIISGCGTIPSPAAVPLSRNVETVAQAPPGPLEVVIKCITSNIEENAGLRIAGIITEEGELPFVFAVPEKSDGLVVICVKELNTTDQAARIRLTLTLRVFDAAGVKIYARSIANVSAATQAAKNEETLQAVTKKILHQYAQDPVLRPLILKYKLMSLFKFG